MGQLERLLFFLRGRGAIRERRGADILISRFTEEERSLNNTTVTAITAVIRANSENEIQVSRLVVSAVQRGAARVTVQV